MQAEYRKEQADTWLWILRERGESVDYAEKMLQYNPGEGRLEFLKRQENGQEYYCYKITGRKALNGIYAMMSIGERQVRSVLCQIFKIMDDAKEYLLSENDFLLLPNYIFASLPKMEIELCYVPGYAVPLKEQMEGLFEYLLNRVDYEDKRAVELLYDCYMLCVRAQGGIKEIRERIEREPEEKSEKEEPHDGIEDGELKEIAEEGWQEAKEGRQEEKMIAESPGSYVTWLTDRFFHRKKKEALLVADQREAYHAERKPERSEMSEEKALTERTVLLSVAGQREEAQLLNEETGEVVFLTKFPFYIGSVGKYADYVLSQSGVSRIHCCINKKEEGYYLSDLNSTNGTYLDGKEVLPGKEELLWSGAVLRIVRTEFCVKLPCH